MSFTLKFFSTEDPWISLFRKLKKLSGFMFVLNLNLSSCHIGCTRGDSIPLWFIRREITLCQVDISFIRSRVKCKNFVLLL